MALLRAHPRSLDSWLEICGESPEHDADHGEADEEGLQEDFIHRGLAPSQSKKGIRNEFQALAAIRWQLSAAMTDRQPEPSAFVLRSTKPLKADIVMGARQATSAVAARVRQPVRSAQADAL